jgi:propionate catabolism operon transcriptional regulator
LFQAANRGTLLLDEIGDMLALRVKLLCVLEERQVRRVASTQSMLVDTRIISTAHGDLNAAITDAKAFAPTCSTA